MAYEFYYSYYSPYPTEWHDIDCDIRCAERVLSDINCDIRCVNTHTVLRDIDCDVRCSKQVLSDINTDIRCLTAHPAFYDVDLDVRCSQLQTYDINCDIRCIQAGLQDVLSDINCDIRCSSAILSDINCDIRCNPAITFTDINCDIRCRKSESAGLSSIRIKINGSYLEDIDNKTLKFDSTSDENPGKATFRLGRYHDDFNRTLSASSSPLTNDHEVEIYYDNRLIWFGYIIGIEPSEKNEEVVAVCVDRKHFLQDELYSVSYGRGGIYENAANALTYVLDDLVNKSLITGYTGLPSGIVTELTESNGVPGGTIITELLDVSGNYKWNINLNGILEIYAAGNGAEKNLPAQKFNTPINLYDIIDKDLIVNDKSNLITKLEVILGTHSSENYNSYRLVSLQDVQLTKDWVSSETNYFDALINNLAAMQAGAYFGDPTDTEEQYRNIFRKFVIPGWTEGSILDTSVPIIITMPSYTTVELSAPANVGGGYHTVKVIEDNNVLMGLRQFKFEPSDGSITFSRPLVHILRSYYTGGTFMTKLDRIEQWRAIKPRITCRFYKREDKSVSITPTIFDVEWIGNGGSGKKRQAVFSSLEIRDPFTWTEYKDGRLIVHNEPGYNDTAYATDRAKLMLSRTNDLNTSGNIMITLDAWRYYRLKICDHININQTLYSNIYNNNNGFPLDILGYSFDGATFQITLDVAHVRPYKATVNYR